MRSVDAVVVLAVVLAGCGGTVERRAGLGTADGSGGVSNLGGSSGSAGGATTVEGSGGDGLGGTGGRTT
ncbi:MAG TPA: hypothetical protein VH142_05580, partial [Polyangiaceae bacterium]|nr:hypothetical protein [Polyangiaceae bacterium]